MKHPLRRQFTFINNQYVRTASIVFLGLMVAPGVFHCYAQSVGKEGNRAVGVVFHEDGTPLKAEEARVGVFHRDETGDYTNGDGVFCIVIPKDVSVFQLVSHAAGYWPYISHEISSTRDPIKMPRITLIRKNPHDKAQLETINKLLQTELAVYRGTSSPAIKKTMREELIKFSESIEIPPWDPTQGLTMREREMRINARTSVDAVVVKMK